MEFHGHARTPALILIFNYYKDRRAPLFLICGGLVVSGPLSENKSFSE